MVRGSLRGYFLDPTKSILVVSPQNVPRAEEYFRGMRVHVVTGSCYLGGFIGDPVTEKAWLDDKVRGWTESVTVLAGVACRHLQIAYADLQKSLLQEWGFIQHVALGNGEAFSPVEEAFQNSFLPALFWGGTIKVSDRGFTHLPVN